MYDEDHLVMISALQHLAFCARQCALIHVEQQWAENRLTILGELLHERVHSDDAESRGSTRITRSLRLVSYRYGLIGQADVVEFQRVDISADGIALEGRQGYWAPFPVEYKKGKPKKNQEDQVQLCAQALCLEEQLNIPIAAGAIFYGEKRRRHPVAFDDALRLRTISLIERMHRLLESGITPRPEYSQKCNRCSLVDICNPKWTTTVKRKRYESLLFEQVT